MTGDTNSNFSGTFKLDGAVILIETEIGCNISIRKGNTIVKIFRQNEAHISNTDPNNIVFLYSIKEKYFGAYDIIATGSNPEFDANINEIVVNENKQYIVKIIPRYYLFKSGLGQVIPLVCGSESRSSATMTTENITFVSPLDSSGSWQVVCFNSDPLDLSKYAQLTVVSTITARSTDSSYGGILFAADGRPAENAGGTHSASHVIASSAITTGDAESTTTLDISSVTATAGYVGVRGGMRGTVTEIYLI